MPDSLPKSWSSTLLAKVQAELRRYDHRLVRFSAEETASGVDLVIAFKEELPGVEPYRAPLHPRDLEGGQFQWTFQRMLYDFLHDYLVELFLKTPQSRPEP